MRGQGRKQTLSRTEVGFKEYVVSVPRAALLCGGPSPEPLSGDVCQDQFLLLFVWVLSYRAAVPGRQPELKLALRICLLQYVCF